MTASKFRDAYEASALPLPERIVQRILDDFTDRSGLSGAWDMIDEDIQNEIIATWVGFVTTELEREE